MLEDLIDEWREAKAEKKAADERFQQIEAKLTEEMKAMRAKVLEVERGDRSYSYTLVAPDMVKIDEDKLIGYIGRRAYNKLTKRVLVTGLVEKAVEDGSLRVDVLSDCSTVSPKKAYVRESMVSED